jgi:hemin uptake protein HemP
MKDDNGKAIDWYILSWSAKWLYDDKVLSDVLTPKEAISRNDERVLQSVWKLLDEADIIIAHNGDRFDLRKIKARFLSHGIMPPMPYKTVDTLKVARKEFALTSNKQDYITKLLGVQEKLDTDFQLWVDCMNGDADALKRMEKYNRHDVIGLEQMYLKLRPYITGHPNIAIMMEENVCSSCGSDSLNNVGKYYYTGSSKYDLYYCDGCMSPHIRGKSNISEKNVTIRSVAK